MPIPYYLSRLCEGVSIINSQIQIALVEDLLDEAYPERVKEQEK